MNDILVTSQLKSKSRASSGGQLSCLCRVNEILTAHLVMYQQQARVQASDWRTVLQIKLNKYGKLLMPAVSCLQKRPI